MEVPLSVLPHEAEARQTWLESYFGERIVDCERTQNSWDISLHPFPTAAHYVDPQLLTGLAWWDPRISVPDVPFARRDITRGILSLNDAWALVAWSRWIKSYGLPQEIIVIHVDDHDDLMSPRIGVTDDGFVDLCTGSSVDIREPVSVEAAIRSGAIGQGSFLVPLLHSVPVSHLRHLCHTIYSDSRRTYHRLVKGTAPDELLEPQALRPLVNVEDGLAEPGQSSYTVTRQPHVLAATLPPDSPILVHIDLDYFNNRFNGDSDFANTPNRHDPTLSEVEEMIDELLAVLIPIGPRIASIAIGMSPGFFPGELWEPAINRLLPPLNELGARSTVG